MSSPRVPTICACCGRPGLHQARGLIAGCYSRHRDRRTLDRFPRTKTSRPERSWLPHGAHGRTMLDRYRQLSGLPKTRVAFELGVSIRQVERYAAYCRAEQDARAEVAA